ncbi:NAD-dependent malic enzyme [Hyphomicrobium facile]|uniref:Malate dehydrogenase (Oxaloacetate-decarboxylating)(NADP+) n=1 Tax=Hyphomicrobium facile TaxID=51670 RepID=A0A1I7MXF2_9HYPH|nr:NAD-dependent malic enzyme [Hyphomicrobium facile]SFV27092.1 malate dehydrogenase (oxaloacetate-decarboxylating)(NADP+) [Hyphomicrobium facile]
MVRRQTSAFAELKPSQLEATPGSGASVLHDPALNKSTAFTDEERTALGLDGLLPVSVENIDRQVARVLRHLERKATDLERYIYLIDLNDRNQTLFYKVVMSDPVRFIPILYDPTIAEACTKFDEIFRRTHGMYVSLRHKGRIREVLRNWPVKDVRFICVSTGGRILGLGDIGANGMGIPIGKLQLYTACASVPPQCLLPILIDIGTTNSALRADPFYLGLRQLPPPDAELDEFVDEFVEAVQEVFPDCCIHFEDWKGTDAIRMLARYRDKVLCYNDDIQGTASVTLAGLETALQILNGKISDQRILFLGAGSAGIGIANLLVSAMVKEGLSIAEARKRISLFDIHGLLEPGRRDLSPSQQVYAHPAKPSTDLVEVIEAFRPTALIGVSTSGGAFDQTVVDAMSRLNKRPIIFALSNPTEKAECTAEEAYRWSKGRALYAAGVQFPDVTIDGETFHPGQANNFYIFPAVGLAAYAARPTRINDEVFIVAARALADQVTPAQRALGRLYPSQADIQSVEVSTAVKVAEYMFDSGLATAPRPNDIRSWIEGQLYKPHY